MNSIEGLIDRLCPDGVEYKALGDVGVFLRGTSFQKKHFVDEGIPCVHYGQLYTYYRLCAYETKSFLGEDFANAKGLARPGDLIIATTSENEEDVCKAMAWLGVTNVVVSNDACIYRHALNPKYVAYFFQSSLFQDAKKQYITGTKVLRVSGANMAKINIPVPPLEVQQEIVKVLDSFAELEARKAQYAYYKLSLLKATPLKWVTLDEIGRFCMCKRIFKNETSSMGDVPFYKIGTFGGAPDAYISRELYADYRERFSYPSKGDLLFSCSGTIGRVVRYDGEPAYYQDSNIAWIANDETIVTNAFLKHWYSVTDWPVSKGGTIGRLYGKDVKKMRVPVFSRENQKRISESLDTFDALVNDITKGLPAEIDARRKQYAYYRDRLLTFKEKKA